MCDNIGKILYEQVQIAFAGTEYPGDDNIVYDSSGRYSDVIQDFRLMGSGWVRAFKKSVDTVTWKA